MARAAVTPTNIPLAGAGVAVPAGVTINHSNGANVVLNPAGKTMGVTLFVSNAGSSGAQNVTVRAGATTSAGEEPAEEAGQGDLVVSIAQGATQAICIESARHVQLDGSINVDFAAALDGGVIYALVLPRAVQ